MRKHSKSMGRWVVEYQRGGSVAERERENRAEGKGGEGREEERKDEEDGELDVSFFRKPLDREEDFPLTELFASLQLG